MRELVLALLLLIAAQGACAKEAAPAVEDPQLETRVMALAEELRCLVCQNQSLADSHADLAIDLKNQIREKLRQGATERQILDYMVERYGDFVLYRPPLNAATLTLWFGPFVLLLAALGALFYRIARRRAASGEVELTQDEHARAAALLTSVDEAEAR